MIERVEIGDVEYAIIIRSNFSEPGVHFFTPGNFSQQLGYMRHPSGHIIEAHSHNAVARSVHFTLEALFLRRGRLRVDFYTNAGDYLESRALGAGDIILLVAGGHGFEVLEEVELIEVKQGPFVGEADKTRFRGITAGEVRMGPCKGVTKKLP